jgi:pantothenate kinase-related protein Tda10
MNIKKELIEKLAQGMVENPEIRAEELLKLRYLLNDLQSNYAWLQAECDMHSNCYEGMDREVREEYHREYDEAKANYYENQKQLKAQYLES